MSLNIIEYTSKPEDVLEAGKFVQVSLADDHYLLFAPKALHQFHNHIVAHFLAERDLPHEWANEEELQTNAPGLVIHGGGRFSVNDREQHLKLWDHSTAYGRFNEDNLVSDIQSIGHRWSNYKIEMA